MFRYIPIGGIDSFDTLKKKVLEIPSPEWEVWLERKQFSTQEDSDTILILNLAEKVHPFFNKTYFNEKYLTLLSLELKECFDKIESVYKNGEPIRVMLVSLPAGCNVKPHVDLGYHLQSCHRIHLPVITDKDVQFIVDDTIIPMCEGMLMEINNNLTHSVENRSLHNRIHLIIDWGIKDDPYYKE